MDCGLRDALDARRGGVVVMTMTGVNSPYIREEYLPDWTCAPLGYELGSIDASAFIPCGSTVELMKGCRGYGMPRSTFREWPKWMTTAV